MNEILKNKKRNRRLKLDITSTTNIIQSSNKVRNAVENVLTQAFGIEVDQVMLTKTAKKIESILGVK